MTFHVNAWAGRNECCCKTLNREEKSRQVSFFSDPKQARLTAASTCQPTSNFTFYGFIWLPKGIFSQPVFYTSIFNLNRLKVDLFPICVVLSNFVYQWLSGVELLQKKLKKQVVPFNNFFKSEFSNIFFGYSQIPLRFYGSVYKTSEQ